MASENVATWRKVFDVLIAVAALVSTLLVTESSAQAIGFDVKDVGVLIHNVHGEGVVIVVQPTSIPSGGIRSPEITGATDQLCEAFGQRAIAFVAEQGGISNPDFVGIRIVSGGSFGRYFFQAYEVAEDG